jgi:hypothetical protein
MIDYDENVAATLNPILRGIDSREFRGEWGSEFLLWSRIRRSICSRSFRLLWVVAERHNYFKVN